MNTELEELQAKVNGVIYNPFVNLKDLAKAIKKNLQANGETPEAITRLDIAVGLLDELEGMDHHNIERIKGFNKTKNSILKITKEILNG